MIEYWIWPSLQSPLVKQERHLAALNKRCDLGVCTCKWVMCLCVWLLSYLLTGSDSCVFGLWNDCMTEQTFAVVTKRMRATAKSRQSLFASFMAVGLWAVHFYGLLLCLLSFLLVSCCSFFEISVLIQQTIAAIMAKNRLLCMVHAGGGACVFCVWCHCCSDYGVLMWICNWSNGLIVVCDKSYFLESTRAQL